VPDFDAVDRLAASLGRIGNIASDGRPILGLDSRDLLEIALQSAVPPSTAEFLSFRTRLISRM
jgi:hypothetical protein